MLNIFGLLVHLESGKCCSIDVHHCGHINLIEGAALTPLCVLVNLYWDHLSYSHCTLTGPHFHSFSCFLPSWQCTFTSFTFIKLHFFVLFHTIILRVFTLLKLLLMKRLKKTLFLSHNIVYQHSGNRYARLFWDASILEQIINLQHQISI